MISTAMWQLMSLALVGALQSNTVAAQPDLPILKSRSKVITIIDGDHVKRDYWVLMPEKNPDIYFVEIPKKPHTVTFRTDVDSLTVPVQFGDQFDFIILLNDKIACPTQIRAEYRKVQPYSRARPNRAQTTDTIPFSLGDNDKIYLKGRLNGGDTLSFQFDLGCGGSVIKKSSVAKAKMQFDGTANLINSDGNNVVPSSSSNRLQIEQLRWEDLPFLVADNMTYREDGLLGNTLFQDKVIEINYDRSVIVIHDTLPAIDATYSEHAIILDGVVPFIQGSLTIDGQQRDGWFMFDTGAYTSILRTVQVSRASKLFGELRKMWSGHNTSSTPRITIGTHTFADFNYAIENHQGTDDVLGLLGNDILKRFNVLLDNQNGFIYLQPNTLANAPYANPEYYLARGILVGCFVLVAGCGWFVYRRAVGPQRSLMVQGKSPD
jgi:hypothetical protein